MTKQEKIDSEIAEQVAINEKIKKHEDKNKLLEKNFNDVEVWDFIIYSVELRSRFHTSACWIVVDIDKFWLHTQDFINIGVCMHCIKIEDFMCKITHKLLWSAEDIKINKSK